MLACRGQDLFTGHHHSKINYLVVITSQDHPDNVLPDVMHIAFDGGEKDFSIRTRGP
jgi:hypothetical protein